MEPSHLIAAYKGVPLDRQVSGDSPISEPLQPHALRARAKACDSGEGDSSKRELENELSDLVRQSAQKKFWHNRGLMISGSKAPSEGQPTVDQVEFGADKATGEELVRKASSSRL